MNKNFLIKEYIIKKKSSGEIAREVGCSGANVIYHLHKNNIKRRSHSEATEIAGKFKKKNLIIKKCLVCNFSFSSYASQKRKYCSRKCYDENRNRSWEISEDKRRYGKLSSNYIDGRTDLNTLIRELAKYETWRKKVFERDNYTCQECFKRGGNLEAHHKKAFRIILGEFLSYYSQFSFFEDKTILIRLSESWKDFWNVDNGITYCRLCHGKNDKYRAFLKESQNEDSK